MIDSSVTASPSTDLSFVHPMSTEGFHDYMITYGYTEGSPTGQLVMPGFVRGEGSGGNVRGNAAGPPMPRGRLHPPPYVSLPDLPIFGVISTLLYRAASLFATLLVDKNAIFRNTLSFFWQWESHNQLRHILPRTLSHSVPFCPARHWPAVPLIVLHGAAYHSPQPFGGGVIIPRGSGAIIAFIYLQLLVGSGASAAGSHLRRRPVRDRSRSSRLITRLTLLVGSKAVRDKVFQGPAALVEGELWLV